MRFIAVILTLILFLIVACNAEKRLSTSTSTPRVKTVRSVKIGRPVKTAEPAATLTSVKTVRSVKIGRPVKATEAIGALADAPTDVAISAPHAATPPNGALPKGAGQPANGALPKGAGQPPMRLVIPRMRLDAGVQDATLTTSEQSGQPYADWFIPYNAVGHLVTTVNPGELGNMVVSGHHNLIGPNQFGKGLFGGLWDLQVGDAIYVFDENGRAFAYEVIKSYNVKEGGESYSVREQHGREILADSGEPILTLITCWNGAVEPYSGNTYRWIVAAHLVSPIQPDRVPVIVPKPTPMQ